MEEFRQWCAYRNKRGSFNIGMRSEFGAAQISMILANVNSKRGGFKLHDFAPYHTKPDDSPIDLQTAMRDWQ